MIRLPEGRLTGASGPSSELAFPGVGHNQNTEGIRRCRSTKAVITAAGRGARQYPASDTVQKAMLPLVDRDGLTKPVLQIIAEEALESGIEEIGVVTAPGDEAVYRDHFRNYASNLRSTYRGVDWAEEQARRLRRPRTAAAVRRPARARGLRPRGLVRPDRSWATNRFCCCWATISISPRSRGGARGS